MTDFCMCASKEDKETLEYLIKRYTDLGLTRGQAMIRIWKIAYLVDLEEQAED